MIGIAGFSMQLGDFAFGGIVLGRDWSDTETTNADGAQRFEDLRSAALLVGDSLGCALAAIHRHQLQVVLDELRMVSMLVTYEDTCYLFRLPAQRGKAVLPWHAALKDECFRAILQDIAIAC